MEDSRDKRPVYMSTFQKRTDKIKSEIKSELHELDDKINIIKKRLFWFFIIFLFMFFLEVINAVCTIVHSYTL
jgi:hypothetical protein